MGGAELWETPPPAAASTARPPPGGPPRRRTAKTPAPLRGMAAGGAGAAATRSAAALRGAMAEAPGSTEEAPAPAGAAPGGKVGLPERMLEVTHVTAHTGKLSLPVWVFADVPSGGCATRGWSCKRLGCHPSGSSMHDSVRGRSSCRFDRARCQGLGQPPLVGCLPNLQMLKKLPRLTAMHNSTTPSTSTREASTDA